MCERSEKLASKKSVVFFSADNGELLYGEVPERAESGWAIHRKTNRTAIHNCSSPMIMQVTINRCLFLLSLLLFCELFPQTLSIRQCVFMHCSLTVLSSVVM